MWHVQLESVGGYDRYGYRVKVLNSPFRFCFRFMIARCGCDFRSGLFAVSQVGQPYRRSVNHVITSWEGCSQWKDNGLQKKWSRLEGSLCRGAVTQTRCITVDLLSIIRKDCRTLPSQGAVGWSTGNRFHSRPVLLDPYAHYIAPHVPGQGECSFFELRGSVLAPGLDQGDSGFTITSLLQKRKRRCPHSRKSNSKASLADSGRRMCKSFVASWWANYALPRQAQCDSHQLGTFLPTI